MRDGNGDKDPDELFAELGKVLWKHAGIIRTKKDIEKGLNKLLALREKSEHLEPIPDINSERFDRAFELKFALPVAEAIVRSALKRKESRGAHYRADYPNSMEKWKKNVVVTGQLKKLELKSKIVTEISEPIKETLSKEYELDYHHLE